MFAFRLIPLIVILVLQFFLFRRAMRWSVASFPGRRWPRLVLTALFGLFVIALFYFLIMRPRSAEFSPLFRIFAVYPFFIWLGATLLLAVLLGAAWFVRLPFRTALWCSRRFASTRAAVERMHSSPPFRRFDASRRLFLRRGMEGVTATAFLGSSYGVLIETSQEDVTSHTFEIEDLPAPFDGFTIGLVTDIHSSVFMTKRNMDPYVQTLNSLGTDIIIVGGDFVNSMPEEVYPFAESFSNLRAPCGVYGVLGNHDHYSGNPDLVAREVTACGVRVLRDEHVVIRRGGASLQLIGIDDVQTSARAIEHIRMASRPTIPNCPTILLSHRPYFLPQAAEAGIDLVLSGHTHGGQIVLARIGGHAFTPAALSSPYVAGPYAIGKTSMYVSRGIGTVAIPVRLNCPPELTRITLRPRQPASP